MRVNGSRSSGRSFDEATVEAVWQKGKAVAGQNPAEWRKDACGAWIARAQYGSTSDDGAGWEIDHIRPDAKGGGDELSNLQPLHWKNNRHKGDTWPNWSCAVSAK
jgi:5-methylcytosine-specific restriction endonuclease McrA